ncbi:hypothetical protein QZN62_00300 [Burkholderia multivorans]|nr:hypothetical protein [Burkholderia multivorans]
MDLFVAMGHSPDSDHVRTLSAMLAAYRVQQPAAAPVGERTALTLLRRAHKALACAALTQIPNGERLWGEIGEYLTKSSEASPAPAADERAAFEAWLLSQGSSAARLERWVCNTDQYSSQVVQAAWEGWTARAASVNETAAVGR